MVLNGQHYEREFYGHCPGGTVLPAYPAVPALIRISNLNHVIYHVENIQRTMLVTYSTSITFISINHGRHDILLLDLFGQRAKVSSKLGKRPLPPTSFVA